MKLIRLQVMCILRHPAWWVGMSLSFIAMLQGMLCEDVSHGLSLVHLMIMSMNFGIFIPLAPLAAVLSASNHLENAFSKTCSYPHLIRSSVHQYLWETGISSALSGAMALATGWAMALVCVRLLGNTPLSGANMLGAEYQAFGTLLIGNQSGLYFALRFLLVFSYGFFCVCCSMPLAAWRQEASVICLVPFVVLRILQYFLYNKLPSFLSPTRILLCIHSNSPNIAIALISGLLVLIFLSTLLLKCTTLFFERRLLCD